MTMDDLRETAELAHLNLGDEELKAAFPAFEQMLGYFAAMQSADEGAEQANPAGASANAKTVEADFFRKDTPAPGGSNAGFVPKMLDNAGDKDGQFLVIPNVL